MPRQRLTIRITDPMRVRLDQFYPDPSSDARTHVIEGDFEFEVEDLDTYVQVKVPGRSVTFTYRDPSGTLAVGDRVFVPFGSSNSERFARVVALGRGLFPGPTKDVSARVLTEALV